MAETASAARTAAEVALWLEAFTVASQQLKESTAQAAEAAWLSFDGWYDSSLVAALARDIAGMSISAQQTTAGMASQYVAGTAAAMGRTASPMTKPWQPIRNGVDLVLVHHRPAEAYRRAVATGSDHAEALVKAGLRAAGLAVSDLSLQDRAAMRSTMQAMGITQFRRVIRPELSKTGTCGLCIVAADRIYSTGDLLPLHPPSCHCVAMAIIGDVDPGKQLNRDDLDALYEAAGSQKAEDLRRTRYQVREHGELGPMLTKPGDNFRGPGRVALEDDAERARQMLDKLLPVLDRLEARAADGESVDGPLAYQRQLIAKLRRILGD